MTRPSPRQEIGTPWRRMNPYSAIIDTDGTNYWATHEDGWTIDEGTVASTVIQSAIDEVLGKIQIKAASYLITARIIPKNNVWLVGEGHNTKLKGTTGIGNAAMIGDTTTFSANSPLTNFTVANMEMDGTLMDFVSTYTPKRKAIDIAYLRRCYFYGLYIHDTPSTGLGIDFMDEVLIDRCIVDTCGFGGDGLATSGANGFGIGTGGRTLEPTIISNCIARNNRNGNFHYEIVGIITPSHPSIYNCYAEGGRYGFRLTGTSAVTIANCQARGASVADYFVTDVSGASTDVTFSNCKSFSSLGDGLQTTHTGSIRMTLDNFQILDAADYGLNLLNSSVIMKGLHIQGAGKTGIYHEPPSGSTRTQFIISDSIIKNNGNLAVAGQNDGIRLRGTGAGFQYVDIHDCICIDDRGGSATQRYGIVIGTGAFTDTLVHDNICQGNVTGGILDNTSSKTRVRVYNNLGYNPVGGASITVTASPFTYTAGISPETVYIRAGTVTDISVGGRTIAVASPSTVQLPPNTAVVVTYAVAPTMEKYIH